MSLFVIDQVWAEPRLAVLFVETGGVYFGLPGIEPWDIERDARRYNGPYPVIAHPPCGRWSQLAHINQKRYGHKVGDDGGCFAHALHCVRTFGGVLEHPAFSYAWPAFDLQEPRAGSWQPTDGGAWCTQVSQAAYGHPARKLTWLYVVSNSRPQPLDWAEYSDFQVQVGWCGNHGDSELPRISKHKAARSPLGFRDLLISIALECD